MIAAPHSHERLTEKLERLFEVRRARHDTNAPMAGMRGVAVTLVFLAHYASQAGVNLTPGEISSQAANVLNQIGHTGVDLFFVISGFLMYGALVSRPQSAGAFLARRVQRIYPTFLFVLALYIGLSILFPGAGKLPATWSAAVWHVVMNALLLPGMIDVEPIITVAWSLSYEAFFYLAIALFAVSYRLHTRRAPARLTMIGGLIVAGVLLTALWFPKHVRLLMFTAGMLLFEIISAKRREGTWPLGLGAAALVAFSIPVLSTIEGREAFGYLVLYVCFIMLCLDAFSWRTLTGQVLSWAPLRWLGNMSYSYYLIHGLTLNAALVLIRELTPVPLGDLWFWILLPPVWLVTLVPSVALFLIVEKAYSFNFAPTGKVAATSTRATEAEFTA